jgi:hypothetical protein
MNPKDLKPQIESIYKRHSSNIEKEKQRAALEIKQLFADAVTWSESAVIKPKKGDLVLTIQKDKENVSYNIFIYNDNPEPLLKLWLKLPPL